jgi:hypothetical protein
LGEVLSLGRYYYQFGPQYLRLGPEFLISEMTNQLIYRFAQRVHSHDGGRVHVAPRRDASIAGKVASALDVFFLFRDNSPPHQLPDEEYVDMQLVAENILLGFVEAMAPGFERSVRREPNLRGLSTSAWLDPN